MYGGRRALPIGARRGCPGRRGPSTRPLGRRARVDYTPRMTTPELIKDFLAGEVYAVAGASRDRQKYGNKVLRCYLQSDRRVYPVHPKEPAIEGIDCVKDLASLPEEVHGLSIITPPPITEALVEAAGEAGIRRIWMQPGAESDEAVARAAELGIACIHSGPCLLVALNFRE